MKAEKVQEHFENLLADIEPSEDVLRLYKEILNRQAIKQLGGINKRLEGLRQRIGELDRERLEALRNANSGQLSPQEKDDLVAAIVADKEEIKDNVTKLEEQQIAKQSSIEYALNFMHDVKRLWTDADPDLKQRFQKMIFPDGLTFNTTTYTFGTESISPLYRYAPNKKDLSELEKSHLVTPRGVEPLIFRMRT